MPTTQSPATQTPDRALVHDAETARRIVVQNFDAAEQARLWLTLGPADAAATLVGALRTALLFAETVILDRNQVFDGPFFVAVSPDRLAWHLGLEPGAALPLKVMLFDRKAERARCTGDCASCIGFAQETRGEPRWVQGRDPDESFVTSTAGGTRPLWGASNDVVAQVDWNLAKVQCQDQRVSSTLAALRGDHERAEVDGTESAERSVHAPVGSERWRTMPDPVTAPRYVWSVLQTERGAETAAALIEDGRQAWARAMREGRVEVEIMKGGPPNVGAQLHAQVAEASEVARTGVVALLQEALAGLGDSLGVPCREDEDEEKGHSGCRVKHATRRSAVVRWLDGERVKDLQPTSMAAWAKERFGDAPPPDWEGLTREDREAAFRWWNEAYVEAICVRDELRTLTLHNALAPGELPGSVEVEWGFQKPSPSRGQVVWDWVVGPWRRRRREDEVRDIAIDGSIVRHVVSFTPAQFVALSLLDVMDRSGARSRARTTRRGWRAFVPAALLRRGEHDGALDLALAVNRVRQERPSYRMAFWRSVRILVVALLFWALAAFQLGGEDDLKEAITHLAQGWGRFWGLLAIFLVALPDLPWEQIRTVSGLRGGAMQATLRVRGKA